MFYVGIFLSVNADVLVWEMNKETGKVIAKLIYQYLANWYLARDVKGILHYI